MHFLKKILIIGIGVIGGSFALAVKRTSPGIEVWGYDLDQESLLKAYEAGIIDHMSTSVEEAAPDADLVIVACALHQTVAVAQQVMPHMKQGAILTEVASVKGTIVQAIESTCPSQVHYVPGHPMAGSEKKGIEGADTYLFENAAYILTPTEQTDQGALDVFMALISKMGARPLRMSPMDHDRQVAAVSHLPHLVAASLVNTAEELRHHYPDLFLLAAGGFRDTTRIASSQSGMWREICLNNRDAILDLLQRYEKQLQKLQRAVSEKDGQAIEESFVRARKSRAEVPGGIKGILPELFEIVAVVPDQPGMIGKIAMLLGEKGINIIDIEILRVREGEGGTMRFGFTAKDFAVKATQVLRKHGFTIYPKF